MWYAIWDTATGRLLSLGTKMDLTPSDLALRGMAVREYQDQPTGVWDPDTREFANAGAQRKVLSKLEFVRKFTPAERVEIFDFRNRPGLNSEARRNLNRFLEELKIVEVVDLGSTEVQAGLQMLETLGFIAPGRAQEILK